MIELNEILVKKLEEVARNGLLKTNNLYANYKNEILKAYLIRAIEETFLNLFNSGHLSGTVHTCIGQELCGVAVCKYLRPDDWITSNHRCHGHFISKTNDWKGLVDELLGLKTGVSKGIGSSQHLFKSNFISNGTQGSLLPVATGLGLVNKKINKSGIAVSFIGEGTLGEGNVYEAMNLSSLLNSPHLFVCENNLYSTESHAKIRQPRETTLSDRVRSFNINAKIVNINDI